MMRSVEEMQTAILDAMPLLEEIQVDFGDAIGAVLSRPVDAPEDLPGFDNAAVDGFAVVSADVAEVPAELNVVDDVAAGCLPSVVVTRGNASRIMTGAPVPTGADAIIPVEDVEMTTHDRVRILEPGRIGDNIRPAGGNVRAGSRVFGVGLRVEARHASVMASMGILPLVRRRPIVAIMSTGDELVPPSTPVLDPGIVRDSNRTLIAGLLAELGVEVIDFGIVPDDAEAFGSALDEAAGAADVIVTSGGVSMGAYDVVKLTLRERGTVDFLRIAMQPGKPLGFGTVSGVPFFGLPGNPVSVFVSFEQFVRPALLSMMGANRLFRDRVAAVLDDGVSTNPEKTVFVRVVTERDGAGLWHARRSGGQSSNVLSALAFADALAVVPVGTDRVEPGGAVELEMMRWPEARTRKEALDDR